MPVHCTHNYLFIYLILGEHIVFHWNAFVSTFSSVNDTRQWKTGQKICNFVHITHHIAEPREKQKERNREMKSRFSNEMCKINVWKSSQGKKKAFWCDHVYYTLHIYYVPFALLCNALRCLTKPKQTKPSQWFGSFSSEMSSRSKRSNKTLRPLITPVCSLYFTFSFQFVSLVFLHSLLNIIGCCCYNHSTRRSIRPHAELLQRKQLICHRLLSSIQFPSF